MAARNRNLEDVYPLSPLQEGMLFHSLYAPESGVYIEQFRCELAGPLDEASFRRAWERAIERHAVLRTAFVWKSQKRPLQAVQRKAELPLHREDWSDLPEEEREARLAAFLAADRRLGFELGRAPLLRLALFRFGPEAHRLVWTSHHLLLDGWSVPLLLSEVLRLYAAFAAGRDLALPPPPAYRDYIAWVGSRDLAAAEAFFRRELAGFDEPTEIATPRPAGPEIGDAAGEAEERAANLDRAAHEQLQALARRARLTLNTLVQGAWAALLGRYARSDGRLNGHLDGRLDDRADDVVFGVTVSGRSAPLPGIESMVGLFINTLPFRARLSPGRDLAAWLADLQERQLALQPFEATPLARIQAWSELAAGTPLVNSLFVFENYPTLPQKPGGAIALRGVVFRERTSYALTASAGTAGDELMLRLTYEPARYDGATAERLLGHWGTLIASLADALAGTSGARLGDLAMLTPAERRQLVREWNPPAPELPRLPLHRRFAAQAARLPSAVAVSGPGGEMTYGELARRARRLARALGRRGVGPESLVAICLDRSLDLPVAILAVLEAGGAYLPLDPAHPPERLAFMLADSGARWLVSRPELAARLPAHGAELVEPEAAGEPEGGCDGCDAAFPAVDPDNLAYVIYTSGSTGRPKGVAVTHAGVSRLLAAAEPLAAFGAGDVWTLFHSYAFDFAVWEMWGALAYGGRLVVVPRAVARAPEELLALLAEERVTVLNQTPSAFAQLAPAVLAASAELPDLRLVVFGGEALDPALLAPWIGRFGDERPTLANLYGITETTVHVTWRRIARTDLASGASPIGRPLADLAVHLLDRHGRLVPVGVPGEMYVGGAGLARGYLGRPELTAERFVPDELGGLGARLYRSGDLARRRPDGELEFLGRADRQVKVRGHRVELGEVEAALSACPGVRAAAVEARERAGGRRLVAYVAADAGVTAVGLRSRLAATLPEPMLPAAFVRLDALPLTPNGKVDRRALAALPDLAVAEESAAARAGAGSGSSGTVAPRDPVEALLAGIWAEVLRLPAVSVEDNFFALGGDSILSLQVVARAAQAGCRITPRQLFEHPTVAGLAKVARDSDLAGEPRAAGTEETREEPATGDVPLTPIQRWFLDREPADPHHFNQALLLAVRRPVAPAALARAIAALPARHDALRLRFERRDRRWRQRLAAPSEAVAEVPLARIDLSALPAERAAAAVTAAATAAQESLDLGKGPLLRALWLDRSDVGAGGDARLFLAVHHLAIDGVSWRVILEELAAFCAGPEAAAPAAPESASFRRWAERLAERARAMALEPELSFWLAQVAEPGDRGRPPAGTQTEPLHEDDDRVENAASHSVDLGEGETADLLRVLPASYGASLADALVAALAWALAGPGGWARIDLEGHGREEEDLDLSRTVGWLTSLYPLLLAPGEDARPGAVLTAVRRQLAAVPGRGIGYGLLRYLRDDPAVAALREAPPSPVSFNYLGQLDAALPPGAPFAPAAEPIGPSQSPRALRSHPLAVGAWVAAGRLQASFGYGARRFDRAAVERLAGRFAAFLADLAAHARAVAEGREAPAEALPNQPLEKVPGDSHQVPGDSLSAAERALLPADLEDAYPLAPLQEGLLFHSLYAPGAGDYVEQLRAGFEGDLDLAAFAAAWRLVAARTPVLRTSFHFLPGAEEGGARPLQVVHQEVPIDLAQEDWRGVEPAEQERRFACLVRADRARGFDLGRAPLMRWTLVRTGEGSWRFLWSHHHALLDGWSYASLIRDFAAAYEVIASGGAPALPARPPYRDFIAWLGRREPGADDAFFRAYLEGVAAPTPIAADRPAGAPPELARAALLLGAPETADLRAAARGAGLTLNTLAQGAWALLLGRLAGSADIVFGATVSGRPPELPGVEAMIGLFINTLPVRVRSRDEEPLGPWLAGLQAAQAELRQHEAAPLVDVQGASAVPRGVPLFETLLVFENYPQEAAIRGSALGRRITELEAIEQTHYPLTLAVVPGERLALSLGYDRARFDATTTLRRLEHLAGLLAALAAALAGGGAERLGAIDLPLSAAERHQLLREWGDAMPAGLGDAAAPVHELFAAQAARRPDAVALSFADGAWTYGELRRRAGRMARRLAAEGVGPGVLVGLCAERSAELILGVLAILEAGGAYLPLDPAHPPERLASTLADAGVPLLLATETLAGRLPAHGARVISLDRLAGEARDEGEAPLSSNRVDPRDLAYVIYTSGSTGRPKGVAVTHGNAARLFAVTREELALGPGDVWTLFHSIAFDFSVWELWGALALGGRLVVVPGDVVRSAEAFYELLRRERVTVLNQTPSAFRQLLWAEERALGRGEAMVSDLRLVIFGGEALDLPSLAPWFQRHGEERPALVNMYGITETTVHVTWRRLREADLGRAGSVVGRPLPDLALRLLDGRGRPVPIGVPGEIHVGGAGVARDYLDRPALTAERFVPDPYSGDLRELRLYRSGDLARWRADGDLEYLGRIDRQVKVRGFRIELGEIEAALGEHPGVREAAVLAREDRAGEALLVGYVSPAGAPGPSPAALADFLAGRLPGYMVPSAWVLLDRLPLTPNGKVDRAALPAPEEQGGGEAYVAPRSSVEEVLAGIWEEVLGRRRVGVEDDFFILGGHSLLATQAMSRLPATFGVDLPLKALFERPTIAALAREIEAARRAGAGVALPPIEPVPRDSALPLSFAQQRLWFLDRLAPGNTFYNMGTALRLGGALDLAALSAAFAALAARHEPLRTTFATGAGGAGPGAEPRQVIAPPSPLPLPLVDLAALPAARREAEAARLAESHGSRPFDLVHGPLVRLLAVRLAPEDHAVSVALHHILADGWSMSIVTREVGELYAAAVEGRAPRLPALPVQYADFAVWQRRWLAGGGAAAQLAFWRARLAGAPHVLELPADRPRPAVESFRGAAIPLAWGPELAAALRGVGRARRATLAMTVLAGYQLVLGRLAGQDDLLVGTPIANRNRVEIEGLIGFFVNVLALRADLAAGGGLGDLVERTRAAALDAYDHQDLPFERLVEALGVERDLGRNPLCQVFFGFQNVPDAALRVGGLDAAALGGARAETGTSKFDLTLFLWEVEGGLRGTLEHNRDLFDSTTIERLGRRLAALLKAGAADPGAPIGELPLLLPHERQQLLVEWNATASPYPAEASLAELFAAQARATPAADAVRATGGAVWSYAELLARASALARRLRALGVGPESRVGLAVERGPALPLGTLAIVLAGGAYVPLDLELPPARLAYLVADSGVSIVAATAGARGALAGFRGEIVLVDPAAPTPAGAEAEPLPVETDGRSLAYVIYTSGSTGAPKGVEVPHRAVARLVLGTDYLQLGAGDRVAQVGSPAFDAVVFELWGPLLSGGAMVVGIGKETVLSPGALGRAFAEAGVTAAFLTSALFQQAIADDPRAFASVRHLLVGGEAVDPRAARAALEGGGAPGRLLDAYGPTEGTCFAAWHPICDIEDSAVAVPIGQPIANTRLYVVDRGQRPLPIGAAGELAIGGDGLARGYAGRPDLTAASFLPDPFSGAPGGRLYRTGDLARQRPDGAVEVLGRIDAQVKLRGFRIELGEIEAALAAQPAVATAAVVLREDTPGDRRLVAYVVESAARRRPEEAAEGAEQVAEWRMLFDRVYEDGGEEGAAGAADPAFNVVGWESSYTGEPLPAAEMREWLDDGVSRIEALEPRRALEIGCGTGMVLLRVAPRCELYRASDVSARAVAYVERALARRPGGLPQVRLELAPAERLAGLADDGLDTVILNSVVQYFPSADYLAEVVERAVAALRPGGAVFLGDLRSLPLQAAFHADLELAAAPLDMPLPALAARAAAGQKDDVELAVAPAFFSALKARLPRLARIEVHPKRMRAVNELSAFRYQVVLRVAPLAELPPAAAVAWRDWRREEMDLAALRALLAPLANIPPDGALGLSHIPNARTARAAAAARLLAKAGEPTGTRGGGPATAGELKRAAASAAAGAVDPWALLDLAGELGWEAELGWAEPGEEGDFCAVLRRRGAGGPPLAALLPEPAPEPAGRAEDLRSLASDPLAARFARRVVPELQSALALRLPEYMIPRAFVLLDAMPLTPNGKIDRRRLPDPEADRRVRRGRAPATPTERALAAIWSSFLRVEPGADDDFFALGGHSLLATQTISRIRRDLGVDLPLRALFEKPTVAGLALEIDRRAAADPSEAAEPPQGAAGAAPPGHAAGAAPPPITPVPRDRPRPLSFAQERLWLLDRLDPRAGLYDEPAAFRLQGDLDLAAFAGALDALVARHEALRTTFPEVEGRPVQRIAPASGFPLPLADLSALPAARREPEAQRLAASGRRRFDLARGPLARGLAVRLAARDHAVVFDLHHIVFDGWSVGVFVRELGAFYRAALAGCPAALPPLPVQYADFAVWQRAWLAGEVLAAELAYWRERLAGAPLLALPADRAVAPAARTGRGAQVWAPLPRAVTARLRALAAGEGATPFMVLLAGFLALLARHAGQEDVVVGLPIAGRNRPEIEGLVGFFVNMLVLRVDLAGDPAFAALLGRAREASLGAFAHQDLPFERLVEELRPERGDLEDRNVGGHHPLFQVAFQLVPASGARLDLPGVQALPFPAPPRAEKFGLSFAWTDDGSDLGGNLEYDPDLYDRATMLRLLEQYRRLLAAAVAASGTALSALPLAGPGERQQVLVEWSAGDPLAEPGATVPALVAREAARRPDAIAVVADGGALTYGALVAAAGRLAARLAHRLAEAGAGPEPIVGISLPRSPERVVAALAVLWAGAAYLPLDADLPPARLTFVANDAGAAAILSDEATARRLPARLRLGGGRRPLLTLEALAEDDDAAAATPAPPPLSIDPARLAYVIYTSGSTGEPKGVAVPHGAVGRLVGALDLGPGHVALEIAPFAFDASTAELWGPLARGACLAIAPPGLRSPQEIAAAIERFGVTALWLTTGLFHQFVEQVAEREPERLASVAWIIAGGDALAADLTRRAIVALPGTRVIDGYGPTENTTVTCLGPLSDPGEIVAGVPLGRPITGTRVYLLDAALAGPVPLGATGELVTGGLGLARGYAGRPDLTAAAFVPDPLSGEPGARLYRTGDLARFLPDGRLDFLGRADRQVKIRGFRIEPAEIEAALAAHPAVRQAAVLPRRERGELVLTAYLTVDGHERPLGTGGLPDTDELKSFLRRRLHEAMIPARWVAVDAFPLTANGKLDRTALERRAPSAGAGEGTGRSGRPFVPPRTPSEEILAAIWSEALGIEAVGSDDDFFALSGHSLSATQVAFRARQSFGVELPLVRLFERATLAELAAEIDAAREVAADGPVAPPIDPAPPGGAIPASFLQEWALALQGGPVSSLMNMPFALRLRGRLDLACVASALAEVVRRHGVLRTTFHREGGELVQRVAPPPAAAVPLPFVDLTDLPKSRREEELLAVAAADARRLLDTRSGPLFTVTAVRVLGGSVGAADHALLFNLHHAIGDGWSIELLQSELAALYRAFSRREPSPLPPLRLQFTDFAWWQRRRLAGAPLAAQLDHWRAVLAGCPPAVDIPADRPRPPVLGSRTVGTSWALEGEDFSRFRAAARGAGCTVSMALIAALKALLYRYTGEPDVLLGAIVSGRHRREVAPLIGMLMNSVTVRTDLSGGPTFRQLLARTRASVLDAYRHQDVPFPALLAALFPGQAHHRTLLFRAAFNMVNFSTGAPADLELPGLAVETFHAGEEPAKYDLLVIGREDAGRLGMSLLGAADLFDAETLAGIGLDYRDLILAAAADPELSLDRLLPHPRHQTAAGGGRTDAGRRTEIHALTAVPASAGGR